MRARPRAAISWSGGKDSCAVLHRTHVHYDIVSMITMFDEPAGRSRSHGLRPEVLDAQADRLGLRRLVGRCTWPTYNAAFAGADALIVTTRAELLDDTWLGRPLRRDMLETFTRLGVDPCGERGEYHTVVTNSPMFSRPVFVEAGERVQRSGCWAIDLVIADSGMRIAD